MLENVFVLTVIVFIIIINNGEIEKLYTYLPLNSSFISFYANTQSNQILFASIFNLPIFAFSLERPITVRWSVLCRESGTKFGFYVRVKYSNSSHNFFLDISTIFSPSFVAYIFLHFLFFIQIYS